MLNYSMKSRFSSLKSFIFRTYANSIPQLLSFQHLREPFVSADSKRTLSPSYSAVTTPFFLTSLESAVTKKQGGIPPSMEEHCASPDSPKNLSALVVQLLFVQRSGNCRPGYAAHSRFAAGAFDVRAGSSATHGVATHHGTPPRPGRRSKVSERRQCRRNQSPALLPPGSVALQQRPACEDCERLVDETPPGNRGAVRS